MSEPLKFDCANNAATSLRIIAEKVRAGDAIVAAAAVIGAGIRIDIVYPEKAEAKRG